MGKWKILDIVDEGVNSEIQTRDFHAQGVDKAWSLLELLAWDSFEFAKASYVSRYSFPIPVHFMLDLIIPFFGVTCAILLTLMLIHVSIMHAMLNLTLHHLEIILMLS